MRRRTGRGRRRSAPTCATPTRSACAGSSAAGRRTSPRSCPSSQSASAGSASRRGSSPSRRDSGSSTRSPASSAARRSRGRWCSCSTTCTGPTSRRCCCCASSPGDSPTPGCSSSAPIATSSSAATTRSPTRSPISPASRRRGGSRCTGSTPEAIASYIELTAGVDRPPPDLAAAIREQTGGNPFFVGEVVRLMAAEGRLGEDEARREVAIPQGVREVVGRRLDRLSEEANEVLRLAAVCGREFELAVLERVSPLASERVAAALDEAVARAARRRLAPSSRAATRSPTRWSARRCRPRFRRRAAPRSIARSAEAIESVHADELDRHLGQLAHHYLEAGQAVRRRARGRVRDPRGRRGRRAARPRGGREPLRAARSRRSSSPARPSPSDGSRCCSSSARPRPRAGRAREARAALERAAALARELERPDRPRPGCDRGSPSSPRPGSSTSRLIALLEEALERIGDADSPAALAAAQRAGAGAELGRPGRPVRRASGSRRSRWRDGSATSGRSRRP